MRSKVSPAGWGSSGLGVLICMLFLAGAASAGAQDRGVVVGSVSDSATGQPLANAYLLIRGTRLVAMSSPTGGFTLGDVPVGPHLLVVRVLGYRPREVPISVAPRADVAVRMEAAAVVLADVVVTGASRAPERIVDAPSALAVVEPSIAQELAPTGQAPSALARLPGVDVVQSGMNDFHVNTRGFMVLLNRRILVLQDGRDLAISFNGAQEWTQLSGALDDFARIEMVRGPGSALYGANAYSGVVNLVTPPARDVIGTRLRITGGEIATLRADVRHASLLGDGWGLKVTGGVARTDTWSRSRTAFGDLASEYAAAVDTAQLPVSTPAPGFEVVPLNGQTTPGPFGTPGAATGDRDPLLNLYGTLRLDRYFRDNAVLAFEGGLARAENETGVTSVGRIQVGESWRPWGRVAYDARRMSLMAYYSGRRSSDQIFLAGGNAIEETSGMYHVEGQYNNVLGNRVQWILGGSGRMAVVNTQGTLLPLVNDDRTDWYGAVFAQVVVDLGANLRFVGSGRVDESNLYAPQLSPRGALVWMPTPQHSLRLTLNGAFQTPNLLEYFAGLPAGPPADFSVLEAILRASPLGPALAGIPNGQLYTNSAAIPILGLGNENLDVERIVSWEVGYKGQVTPRIVASVDLYYSQFSRLVTDLLPGANPAYGPWTAPPGTAPGAEQLVADATRDALIQGGQPAIAQALTRLPDGSTAIVFSIGNAGDATAYGFEVGAGWEATAFLRFDANYSYFQADVEASSLVVADVLEPNTPTHKANLSASVATRSGISGRASLRLVDSYDWATGVYFGRIPSSQTLDVSLGYQVTPQVRVHAIATNLLDQRRYHVYGGSVIGRRVLGGATVAW